jgi:hypothetical protein
MEKIDLKEEYYDQVLNSMPKQFRDINIQSYQLGQGLYQELINNSS